MFNEVKSHLGYLREHCYPFAMLSGNRAAEAIESLKVFELEESEQVVLKAGTTTDYLYVLEGTVAVSQGAGPERSVSPCETRGHPLRIEPAQGACRIEARSYAVVARADGEVLDYLLSWETLVDGPATAADQVHSRIATVKRSLAFRRLPLEAVEEAFRRMSRVVVKAGDEVVRQGEPGDAFYIIESGRAEVWQTGIYDDEPRLVAELGEGQPFGEEALVLKGSRNATVRMVADGSLLVLGQEDFDELFNGSLIQRVAAPVAKAYIESGHTPIDVRYDEEVEEGFIHGALFVPLDQLRQRIPELDPKRSYVAYCKSGGRSAVATLLLKQRNFNVVSLEGGLRDWPFPLTQPAA